MKMDYFRVDVCWVAMTINCALIKLISQFLEYCYGSFDCSPAQHPYLNTSSKWNACMREDHSIYGKVFHCEITGRVHENLDTK